MAGMFVPVAPQAPQGNDPPPSLFMESALQVDDESRGRVRVGLMVVCAAQFFWLAVLGLASAHAELE